MMYDDWDGHDWGWGALLGMGAMTAGVTAVLVLLVVLVVRATAEPRPPTTQAPTRDQNEGPPATSPAISAARLLDERFARGDIDEQEYLARRDLLRS